MATAVSTDHLVSARLVDHGGTTNGGGRPACGSASLKVWVAGGHLGSRRLHAAERLNSRPLPGNAGRAHNGRHDAPSGLPAGGRIRARRKLLLGAGLLWDRLADRRDICPEPLHCAERRPERVRQTEGTGVAAQPRRPPLPSPLCASPRRAPRRIPNPARPTASTPEPPGSARNPVGSGS